METRQLLSAGIARPASGNPLNSDGSTNFDRIIEASAARSTFGLDGSGEAVAVIDTGVDYKNAAFGGAIGSGDKVVTGVNFTGASSGVIPTWQHGTGVAGLVAGSSPGYSGVAPGASIIPLRVFGDNNQGSFQEIALALQWVVQNHSLYNITAVNLSISDGNNYTSNLFANDGSVGQEITAAIDHLAALDIPLVTAAGNSFDGRSQGMGFPAVVPGVVSVTASDAKDNLAGDAQRLGNGLGAGSSTTIAAPGVNISAPSGDAGTTTESGTSFATPQVTGSILLLQQLYERAYHVLPTIPELDRLLQEGAVPIHDGATGVTIGRLDVLHSAQILDQQIVRSQAPTPSDPSQSPVHGTITTTTLNSNSSTPSVPAPAPAPAPSSPTPAPTPTPSPMPAPPTPPPVPLTPSTIAPNPAPAPTPAPVPLTQVFVNGVSIGNYSTSALAAKYPSLFEFLKGPVPTLRIWAANGSKVDLGPSVPSSSSPVVSRSSKGHATAPTDHAISLGMAVPVVHHSASHKAAKKSRTSSFLSYLFPFKF